MSCITLHFIHFLSRRAERRSQRDPAPPKQCALAVVRNSKQEPRHEAPSVSTGGARRRPARQASAVPACHAGASGEVSHVTNAAGNGGLQVCDHPPAQDVLLPTQEPAGVLIQALGRPASHLQEKARLQWLPQPR